MSEVEEVVEGMELQPDPEVTRYFFDLFSKEALLSYAGILIKIGIVVLLMLLVRQLVCHCRM